MKKLKLYIPFLLIPVIIPIYSFLDTVYLVKVFGCGCNTGFNANDLRRLVFGILGIITIFTGLFLSRKFTNKINFIIYNVSVIIMNIFYWNFVVTTFMWK